METKTPINPETSPDPQKPTSFGTVVLIVVIIAVVIWLIMALYAKTPVETSTSSSTSETTKTTEPDANTDPVTNDADLKAASEELDAVDLDSVDPLLNENDADASEL